MLPDPKDVAKGIRHLFRSKEEKQQAVENERDLQLRQGKNRIRAHIAHQREMLPKLRALARRALAMGDETRFRQVGKQLLWTENDITRWERYTLTLEMMEARRDQVRASAELVHTIKIMSDSMNDWAGSEDAGQLQTELDRSLAQADSTDQKIGVMMDMMDATLAGGIPADEESIEKLRESLGEEIVNQGNVQVEKDIDAGLEKIRKQLETEDGTRKGRL